MEHGGQVSLLALRWPSRTAVPLPMIAARVPAAQVSRAIAAMEAPRPMYEFGWNHTTLHALKHDKSTTYLQSVLEPEKALALVDKVISCDLP